ncbi:membrane protein insertion efficiency factor YidD [Micrococcus cohnii]|uniref:Putative membrane protein insertion efficiency factor n=1 Tax=Micrococcus cohnii TaxID=993416 RepID=A0A7W7M441_9MICC|nr:membrane protein insertion efficiency factor YidD [Micrococcus cohnii]MBB4736264.1 putative membrane protein insertion efficiency factor [Micrococcus cohnii]
MTETRPDTSAVAGSPFVVREPSRQWGPLRAAPSALLAALLTLYRAVVSPLYGDVCRYFPSCSAYGLEAVHVHGAVAGTLLTVRRLSRCHPWADGGLDPVPPGRRRWPPGEHPRIIDLNHPPIPPDPSQED